MCGCELGLNSSFGRWRGTYLIFLMLCQFWDRLEKLLLFFAKNIPCLLKAEQRIFCRYDVLGEQKKKKEKK